MRVEVIEVESRKPVTELERKLVREVIDGIPFYYKGYRKVLSGEKTLEEVMGSSSLQSAVVGAIVMYLGEMIAKLDLKPVYWVCTNEAGLQLGHGDTLASDICIYDAEAVKKDGGLDEHYFKLPPKVAVEVDVRVESGDFTGMGYYLKKTKKLFEVGTERVIWVSTDSREIILRDKDGGMRVIGWHEEAELLPGIPLRLRELMEERGFSL